MSDLEKQYRVLIKGSNFLMDTEKGISRLGFFLNCFVEAGSAQEAELAAVEEVQKRDLPKILNKPDDPPMLFAEEISVREKGPELPGQQGFIFFPDEKSN